MVKPYGMRCLEDATSPFQNCIHYELGKHRARRDARREVEAQLMDTDNRTVDCDKCQSCEDAASNDGIFCDACEAREYDVGCEPYDLTTMVWTGYTQPTPEAMAKFYGQEDAINHAHPLPTRIMMVK